MEAVRPRGSSVVGPACGTARGRQISHGQQAAAAANGFVWGWGMALCEAGEWLHVGLGNGIMWGWLGVASQGRWDQGVRDCADALLVACPVPQSSCGMWVEGLALVSPVGPGSW